MEGEVSLGHLPLHFGLALGAADHCEEPEDHGEDSQQGLEDEAGDKGFEDLGHDWQGQDEGGQPGLMEQRQGMRQPTGQS